LIDGNARAVLASGGENPIRICGGDVTENFPAHFGADGDAHAGMTRIGTPTASSPDVLAEYRLSRRYRRPSLNRFLVTGVIAALMSYGALNGANPGSLTLASLVLIAAVYNGAMYVWRARFRTRVTTHGIEIHGYFIHFVPWSAVKAIQDEGYGYSQPLDAGYDGQSTPFGRRYGGIGPTTGRRARLGVVRIFRHHGKSVMLRAPLVTAWAPDPYFTDKLSQMQALSGQYGTRQVGS
jgi:hypothetical protein